MINIFLEEIDWIILIFLFLISSLVFSSEVVTMANYGRLSVPLFLISLFVMVSSAAIIIFLL